MRSTLGLKQIFLNNVPKTLKTNTQTKINLKFSTFKITQRNFQNIPFSSTNFAPKAPQKNFFATPSTRRHYSATEDEVVEEEELDEELGEKKKKINLEAIEEEIEVEKDLLTKMPNEKERIDYYQNFKITTEVDCAKFTKLMRSLPLRQLSLEEVLFFFHLILFFIVFLFILFFFIFISFIIFLNNFEKF